LAILKGHTEQIWGLDVSPDGTWLASGGRDKSVRIWNLPDAVSAWKSDPHSEWDLLGVERDWTSEKGEEIGGEFVGLEKDIMTIKETSAFNGPRTRTRMRKIALAALSQADQDFIKRRLSLETEP
jgi:WD40 repeat protein